MLLFLLLDDLFLDAGDFVDAVSVVHVTEGDTELIVVTGVTFTDFLPVSLGLLPRAEVLPQGGEPEDTG